MGFLDLKYEAFGLDINDLSLRIVKLKKKYGAFAVVSFNEVRIEPGIIEEGVIKNEDALVKIIKSACATVKGKKLKTKYVVASLPEEKSFLQVIQMPKMTEEELALAVPLEAENYIPMPIDSVYLDFRIVPAIKETVSYPEVLIVAMAKTIVDSYVSCFKKAGLTPVVLETESKSIARALVSKESNISPIILVDFGRDNTNFIIFSGSTVRFTSSIPISSQLLTQTISNSLKISFDEAEKLKIEYGLNGKRTSRASSPKSVQAERVSRIVKPLLEDLVDQIKKYLNFYRDHSSYEYLLPEGKKERIILCGGGAELKGLANFMANNLGISVEMGDPFTNFLTRRPESIIKKDLISFTTVIGLALRQINKSNS